MTGLNVLDSSGWIELLSTGPGAGNFEPLVASVDRLIVPAISIFEVVRWSLNREGTQAEAAAELMRRGTVIDLDADLAVAAAMLSRKHKLSLADSIILATARRHAATLWTQDVDFDGLDGVRYFPRVAAT